MATRTRATARTDRERRLSAYHEAGHAVVAEWLGLGVRLVSIDPHIADPPPAGVVVWGTTRLRRSRQGRLDEASEGRLLRDLTAGLSGMLAQQRVAGRLSARQRAEVRSDLDHAGRLALLVAEGDDDEAARLLSWAEVRADRLLDAHWAQVMAVADVLLAQATLTGAQMRRTMHTRRPRARPRPGAGRVPGNSRRGPR